MILIPGVLCRIVSWSDECTRLVPEVLRQAIKHKSDWFTSQLRSNISPLLHEMVNISASILLLLLPFAPLLRVVMAKVPHYSVAAPLAPSPYESLLHI